MHTWQSKPIEVDGIQLQIHVSDDGVTFGKLVDGVYASDLLLTPEQTIELAEALIEGTAKCLAMRKG